MKDKRMDKGMLQKQYPFIFIKSLFDTHRDCGIILNKSGRVGKMPE